MWVALLTGYPGPGREIIGGDVRDATGRVPLLWYPDTEEHQAPCQRFYIDAGVPPQNG